MISEKNRELVDRAIKLLTPPGLKCSKSQIKKARKYLHDAVMILSAAERRRELRVRRQGSLKRGELERIATGKAAIEVRWAKYREKCGMMTNDEFCELSHPWRGRELAAYMEIPYSRVVGYRRKVNPVQVPNEVAEKLMELVKKVESGEIPPPDDRSLPVFMTHAEFKRISDLFGVAETSKRLGVKVGRVYAFRNRGCQDHIPELIANKMRELEAADEKEEPNLFPESPEEE